MSNIQTVTIGRGTAVHAAAKFGTLCADFVRPGHAAARRKAVTGEVTCKTCRKMLGLPVDAPKPTPKPAATPAVRLTETAEWKEYRAMQAEVSRLLRAGDREAALALDAKMQAMKTW